MASLKYYITFVTSVFFILLLLLMIETSNNPGSPIIPIYATLIGSSITGILTLSLEALRIEREKQKEYNIKKRILLIIEDSISSNDKLSSEYLNKFGPPYEKFQILDSGYWKLVISNAHLIDLSQDQRKLIISLEKVTDDINELILERNNLIYPLTVHPVIQLNASINTAFRMQMTSVKGRLEGKINILKNKSQEYSEKYSLNDNNESNT